MTVIINGTTGVTFPNGVTMSDGTSAPVTVAQGGTGANTASAARTALGVAIGTDVLAPNGSGANLTSLNASSISAGTLATARLPTSGVNAASITTGTLAIANGGTGTTTPSLVGGTNITISGTWPNQTVTAAGGGVTSLNGETGAITNTNVNSIGSTIYCANNNSLSQGATTAGSSMRYYSGGNNAYQSFGSTFTGTWRLTSVSSTPSSSPSIDANNNYGTFVRIS